MEVVMPPNIYTYATHNERSLPHTKYETIFRESFILYLYPSLHSYTYVYYNITLSRIHPRRVGTYI